MKHMFDYVKVMGPAFSRMPGGLGNFDGTSQEGKRPDFRSGLGNLPHFLRGIE